MIRDIIQTEYFRVVVVDDEDAVEICGALKVRVSLPLGSAAAVSMKRRILDENKEVVNKEISFSTNMLKVERFVNCLSKENSENFDKA